MGKSGAARVNAKDAAYGAAMQDHEDRLDLAGTRRRVRDVPPLVYSPYAALDAPNAIIETAKEKAADKDIRISKIRSVIEEKPRNRSFSIMDACAAHVEGARKKSDAQKVFLHGFMQFPTDIKVTAINQEIMLAIAVDFINETYGGNAVFHARIDRDEKGQHGADVFFAPRYEKHTKSMGIEQWISLSKFSKENARKRYDKRPKTVKNKKTGKFNPVYDKNGEPVMVWNDAGVFQGRALQDAWYEHLQTNIGEKYNVERGKRKKGSDPDRLSPEEYAVQQEQKKLRAEVERQLDAKQTVGDTESPHAEVAAKLIHSASERAMVEARVSSEHIIDAARDDVDQMVIRAQECAVTDVRAIRAAMLSDGEAGFVEMKEEIVILREEVLRLGRIVKIWNEIIKQFLPMKMRKILKDAFDVARKKQSGSVAPSAGPEV